MNLESIAVRLVFAREPESSLASGFILSINERLWLITAAHALEDRSTKFSGSPDCIGFAIVDPKEGSEFTLLELAGRRVRYAAINGQRVDFAAIELSTAEVPLQVHVHTLNEQISLGIINSDEPITFRLVTAEGIGDKPGDRELAVIGYPGGGNVSAVRVAEHNILPTLHSRAAVFSPGLAGGVSGGPVFERLPNGGWRLYGIYTHHGDVDIQLALPDGRALAGKVDVGHATKISVVAQACSDPAVLDIFTAALGPSLLPFCSGPARSTTTIRASSGRKNHRPMAFSCATIRSTQAAVSASTDPS